MMTYWLPRVIARGSKTTWSTLINENHKPKILTRFFFPASLLNKPDHSVSRLDYATWPHPYYSVDIGKHKYNQLYIKIHTREYWFFVFAFLISCFHLHSHKYLDKGDVHRLE